MLTGTKHAGMILLLDISGIGIVPVCQSELSFGN